MIKIKVFNREGLLLLDRSVEKFPCIFGRDYTCDVVIEDQSISSRHASLENSATGVTLKDLESTNGSYCKGAQISEVLVDKNMSVFLGSIRVELYVTDVVRESTQILTRPLGLSTVKNSEYTAPQLSQKPKANTTVSASPRASTYSLVYGPKPTTQSQHVNTVSNDSIFLKKLPHLIGFTLLLISILDFVVMKNNMIITITGLILGLGLVSVFFAVFFSVISKLISGVFNFKVIFCIALFFSLVSYMAGKLLPHLYFNLESMELEKNIGLIYLMAFYGFSLFFMMRVVSPNTDLNKIRKITLGIVGLCSLLYLSTYEISSKFVASYSSVVGYPIRQYTAQSHPVSELITTMKQTVSKVEEDRAAKKRTPALN